MDSTWSPRKLNPEKMKTTLINFLTIFFLIGLISGSQFVMAQDEEEPDNRPVRAPFESVWLLDGQTVLLPNKGTFEFDIIHRFGTVGAGASDLWGMYSPSNIRLGLSYTPIENLTVGFGNTKDDDLLDFSVKYSIIKQTRSWSIPVSVTYFGNAVMDTGKEDHVDNGLQRWSYFHELIIATRFNSKLSVQIAPSFSHYNGVDSLYSNDVISASIKARYKLSPALAAIVGYDHPFTDHETTDLDLTPSLAFGLEIATSAHAFQIFLGNSRGIVPQRNAAYGEYGLTNGKFKDNFLIGFNITRLWNF